MAGLERLLAVREELLKSRVPAVKVQQIFGNVESLLSLHRLLLSDLQSCTCTTVCSCTAAVFVRYADVFKLYTDFVNNFEKALAEVAALKANNSAFQKWSAQQREPAQLTSLLIAPIQRIPRYMLLLQQLARHTPVFSNGNGSNAGGR